MNSQTLQTQTQLQAKIVKPFYETIDWKCSDYYCRTCADEMPFLPDKLGEYFRCIECLANPCFNDIDENYLWTDKDKTLTKEQITAKYHRRSCCGKIKLRSKNKKWCTQCARDIKRITKELDSDSD